MQEMIRNTELEEATEKGIKHGLEKGREQGAREKSVENVKNALKLGVSADIISKITGLSIAEIETLKNK